MMQLTSINIKGATKMAACASLLRAFLIIIPFLINGWFYELFPFIEPFIWIVISVFYFTLHKNMK